MSGPAPFALLINGSINAGKTTVAKALQALVPRLAHVEVDALNALLSASALTLEQRIPLNLRNAALVARTFLDAGLPVVVTYPLYSDDHAVLSAALAPYPVHTYTLAPPLETALADRGTRSLTGWEKDRIRHHYATGIPRPTFGVVLDNSDQPPSVTAVCILESIPLRTLPTA
jgi:hypothetical protein